MQSAESILSLKREKFRTNIRKQEMEKQFQKKRLNPPKIDLDFINEQLERIRNQIIAVQENLENDFPKAMNKYYDHLVDKDMMNDVLSQFQKNYDVNCRITIYWILTNLTLGDGIGQKFLFDTTFDFLNYLYTDLKNKNYTEYVLEIIQNLLADRDIDVFEYLMKQDQLLQQINENISIIETKTYEKIIVHICIRIVQFKSHLSDYLVNSLCQLMPKYVAFQSTYILVNGMEFQNHHLIFHSLTFFDQICDKSNYIILKIIQQVEDSQLLIQIVDRQDIINTMNKFLFNSKNPDDKNMILNIYHNIFQIDEIKHKVCREDIIKYIIYLSLQQEYVFHALKFLNNLTNDIEILNQYSELIGEDYFVHHLQNLDPDEGGSSIQALMFIKNILEYGDFTNDDIYQKLFREHKEKIEYLYLSDNDVLSYQAKVLLQCYD